MGWDKKSLMEQRKKKKTRKQTNKNKQVVTTTIMKEPTKAMGTEHHTTSHYVAAPPRQHPPPTKQWEGSCCSSRWKSPIVPAKGHTETNPSCPEPWLMSDIQKHETLWSRSSRPGPAAKVRERDRAHPGLSCLYTWTWPYMVLNIQCPGSLEVNPILTDPAHSTSYSIPCYVLLRSCM